MRINAEETRAYIQNDFDRAVAQAVRASRNATAGPSGGGSGGFNNFPSGNMSVEGTDGDGNVITRHRFMIGVDAIGDPRAAIFSEGSES